MTAPAIRGVLAATTTPSAGHVLEARLGQERQALSTRGTAASALMAAGIVTALVAVAACVLGDGRWIDLPAPLPLVCAVVAVTGAAFVFGIRHRRLQQQLTMAGMAGVVEREQQLREGALRGALEVAATGALGARAADDVARRLVPGVLTPALTSHYTRTMGMATIGAVVGISLLVVASRVAPDGLAAVLQPVSAWRGTLLAKLAFDQLATRVPRGMPVTVRELAAGRHAVTVSRRSEGEAWRDTVLSVPAEGRVALALGPVRAATELRVNDGRSLELTAALVVEERGWLGDVSLRAVYPAYLGRADESLEPVPPLRVPRGTRVTVRVMLRGGAREAVLSDGRTDVPLVPASAAGDAVPAQAVIMVDRDGTWGWRAQATPRADGAVLAPELPDSLPFTVIPDQIPSVQIVAPATDTVIGPTGEVPVWVDAGDDHGVSRVHLVVWKEVASGAGIITRERVEVASPQSPVFEGGATVTLDGRGLEPGDKVHVTAVATDDSPWAQQAQSAEVVLRVPTLSEQRAMARSLADSLAAKAMQLAQQEKRLQQNTADASRNRDLKAVGDQANGGQKNDGKPMSFTAAEKAKQLAREQQQLSAKVDSLRMNAKELESRLKNANALDTTLAGRMRDIQKMLRDAMTPEMQKQLEELNKNSDRLSGTQAQQSMQQLAEAQKQMREQLERSAEMLKRASLEGAMQTLRDEAKELSRAQQQAADRMDGRPQQSAGKQSPQDARQLADRSRDLERDVQALAKKLEEAGAKPGASKTREAQPTVKEAADAMNRAAQMEKAQQNPPQNQPQGPQPNQPQNGQPQNASGQQGQQQGQQGQQGQQQGQQGEQQGQQRGQQGQQGQSQQARQAADAMERASQQLSQARDAQVNAWKGELSDQLDQSINETMQLARQQAELEKKMRQQGQQGAQGMQGEQAALQQGVQQAAERLEQAGRQSSLLSQRSQKQMAEAQRRVQQATQAMQQAGQDQPGGTEQAQSAMKDASEALNQALSSLVRDRERVNNAQSASGFTEMMEQLKQLAQQQGQLNSQLQGLNMMPGGAKGDQAQQQARVLAKQQRDVARSLTDVSDADQTGRTDALAKEAQQLAQQIERNGLDPAVAARQQQLYRRLLDAGRFLEQEERDDQGPREAKAGNGNGSAGRVDGPQSGKAGSKYAPPTWNELRGLGPDERRIVIEYFRRLNGSTPP